MEVIIDRMESSVRAVDGDALLHPRILDRITGAALARVLSHLAHEQTVRDERKPKPAVTSREIAFWE
jgi:hypothetical protein